MIVYDVDTKNRRLQVVIDELESGPGNAYMVIATAGMATELARVALASPPFSSPAGGEMRLAGPRTDPDCKGDGEAAAAAIYDGSGKVRVSGLTVGPLGSGKDVIISTARVVPHQRLEVTSGTIRHG